MISSKKNHNKNYSRVPSAEDKSLVVKDLPLFHSKKLAKKVELIKHEEELEPKQKYRIVGISKNLGIITVEVARQNQEPSDPKHKGLLVSKPNPIDRAKMELRGYYTTPAVIAESMVERIENSAQTILDPCCGNGVFHQAFEKKFGTDLANFKQIDIAQPTVVLPKFQQKDFFEIPLTEKYAVIIANPPYLEYQDTTRAAFTRACSFRANLNEDAADFKPDDLYLEFIYKILYHLKDDGEAILLVPALFLSGTSPALSEVRRKIWESGVRITHMDKMDGRIFQKGNASEAGRPTGPQIGIVILRLLKETKTHSSTEMLNVSYRNPIKQVRHREKDFAARTTTLKEILATPVALIRIVRGPNSEFQIDGCPGKGAVSFGEIFKICSNHPPKEYLPLDTLPVFIRQSYRVTDTKLSTDLPIHVESPWDGFTTTKRGWLISLGPESTVNLYNKKFAADFVSLFENILKKRILNPKTNVRAGGYVYLSKRGVEGLYLDADDIKQLDELIAKVKQLQLNLPAIAAEKNQYLQQQISVKVL